MRAKLSDLQAAPGVGTWMANRRAFILASVLIHAGIGAGVFISQVWGIERLDSTFRSSPGLAVLMPPMPAPAGSPDLPKVQVEKKQKKIIKDPVQPTRKIEDTSTKPDVPVIGAGSGSGSGSGPGSSTDVGDCVVDCGPGIGSGSATPPKQDPPKQDEETFVPPNVLTMMRTSGSTQIHPSTTTKNEIINDGKTKVVGVAKVCVSATGAVTHVSMMQSTKYPAYDAKLIDGIRSWTYKPYTARGGQNVKVCGTVTFVYGMK